MPNRLIIVESPSKARTLAKFLGAGYTVKASMGHIRDLPKSTLGVDLENGFRPEYIVIRGKEKQIRELRDAAGGDRQHAAGPRPGAACQGPACLEISNNFLPPQNLSSCVRPPRFM